MKPTSLNSKTGSLIIALGVALTGISQAQVTISPPNYLVTIAGPLTSQYKFDVNGQDSGLPGQFANVNDSFNFSLNAGATYIFTMNTTAIHPVDICTSPSTALAVRYSGASAQGVSSGTVMLTIPATNYPTTLYYICQNHQFYGIITVNPPQPPPPTTITKTSLTTNNIVLTFTGGTNTIAMVPQFSSNLVTGAWLPVPGYTNRFGSNANSTFTGTNTISFNRLDAICGPNVFLRVSQAPN